MILRRLGGDEKIKVKKQELARLQGSCDIAVEVKEASWDRGTARFKFDEIGQPSLPNRPNGCKKRNEDVALEVSGFNLNEPSDLLIASLGELLQTPDQYLSAQGVPSAPPPVTESRVPGVTQPTPLLSIDPAYSREASREKYQGTVVLRVTIGADGRIEQASVVKGTGKGLDESALRSLSMWRFEPARKLDKPVAFQLNLEISFHIY